MASFTPINNTALSSTQARTSIPGDFLTRCLEIKRIPQASITIRVESTASRSLNPASEPPNGNKTHPESIPISHKVIVQSGYESASDSEDEEQSEFSLNNRSIAQVSRIDPIVPMSFCHVCDKVFNNELQLKQHREGKIHKEKAEQPYGGAGVGLPLPAPKAFQNSGSLIEKWDPAKKVLGTVAQHANFQNDNPELILQRRSNPNKESSYRCMVCPTEPLVGPIYRALAHTITAEHKNHVAFAKAQDGQQSHRGASRAGVAAPNAAGVGMAAAASAQAPQRLTDEQAAPFQRVLAIGLPSREQSWAADIIEQHTNFQKDHPELILQRRSNPNKEPSYRCTVCPREPLVGPLDRALAHTITQEHKKYKANIDPQEAEQSRSRAAAAVPSAGPSSVEKGAVQNDEKQKLPLTTDAQAELLLQEYQSTISQPARTALSPFNKSEQLQIVKEVDLWNRQTPTGKEGRPINLSARVVHVCKLKAAKLNN